MSEHNNFAMERLNNFLEELEEQDIAPEEEITELYIKELNGGLENPGNKDSLSEYLYNLASVTYRFAEIYEERFSDHKNSLRFREIELAIADRYKLSGDSAFRREPWKIYFDISSQYISMNENSKAADSAKKALALLLEAESKPNPKSLSLVYSNIAYVCRSTAPSKAVSYFRKASDTIKESGKAEKTLDDYTIIGFNSLNIAIIMDKTGDYNEAVRQSQECIELFEKIRWKYGMSTIIAKYTAYAYAICARAYCAMELYEHSETNAAKGIKLCKKIRKSDFSDYCEIMDILYSVQSQILCEKGKFLEAIEYQYKLLVIWSDNDDSLKQTLKTGDIYVDISNIFFRYLDQQGMSVESARLSLKEIRPYMDSDLAESDVYALSVHRRSLINLANIYSNAMMYQSAEFSYKKALEVIKMEMELKSNDVSLTYSHSYALYNLAVLNFKSGRRPQGGALLGEAYKIACSIKECGGIYETLYDTIFDALKANEKN